MAADITFAVEGMTCVACVRFVEKEVSKVAGVDFVSVNLATGKAYAVTDGRPGWDEVAGAVRKAGYEPLETVPTDDEIAQKARAAGRRVLTAWAVAIPAMILMILHMAGVHLPWLPVFEAVAGFAVVLGPGRRILKGAWVAITHRHANMDVLVSLGSLAAWLTAVLAAAGLGIRSFGALAPMLPAFHLTGRLLEARLKRQAGADLRKLMSDGNAGVQLVDENGEIREIPVSAVKEGARIRVRTGERIPLDGRIVLGDGAVSEAMVTGESLPAAKTVGDELIGGTVLEKGLLEIEVTRTGEDAFLARMLTLVEQAQGAMVPLQALADKIAGVFVPVILGLTAVVFTLWTLLYSSLEPLLTRAVTLLPWVPANAGEWTTAVYAGMSLLVVACPCALGLAIPMAVNVGTGLAARLGLLIKGGEALQTAGELDVLIFDKTGTLTEGHPAVVWSDLDAADKAAAGALESLSVHPLARAVAEWGAPEHPVEVTDVAEIAGEGISGRINDAVYFLGRPKNPPEGMSNRTWVEVRKDNKTVGHIALADPIKTEAADAVAALMKRKIKPVMATGDTESTARAVAAAVNIGEVHASLRPEEKLRLIQDFQKQELRVGMVGDGINDAAALKAADVGFAMAQGADLSMEAGDVVITHGGLERILSALHLSALITRKIRANLFWAFAYNILALPAAGMALIHPLIAEAAMSLSSVAVVVNSVGIRKAYARKRRKSMNQYVIEIKDMSCNHCVSKVEKALKPLSDSLRVNLESKTATVKSEGNADALLAALDEAGYPGILQN